MRAPSAFAISFAFLVASLLNGTSSLASAETATPNQNTSPALCGPGDMREPGIQGDVPAGATANYNCGVRLVGQLPRSGNVQGIGDCAYVRVRGPNNTDGDIYVVDVRNPAHPVEVTHVPIHSGSETFRVVVNRNRAVMVSGSSVYDVRNCLRPAFKGDIQWPPLSLPGIATRLLPHDIRVNHAGTKVYAAFGLWEADISNLADASTWKVTDHRCELAAQVPGPWQEVHRAANAAGQSLCADSLRPNPRGAQFVMGASPLQSALLWPSLSHSPDLNADDTRLYIGDQAGGNAAAFAPIAKVRIVDITQSTPRIIGEVDGAGHGLDWFRVRGRDYVLASNERGQAQAAVAGAGDSCQPYPRSYALGNALEAYVSDVTEPARAHHVSMVQVAINNPENCATRRASGGDASIAYHLIDNAFDAHFAAVNFGSAGLRIYDIRDPAHPSEVAYFNHGPLVHAGVGYYDARRGLIYAAGASGLWILQVEPQVRRRLGI